MSMRIDQSLLNIWMYKYLLGTLSKDKVKLLEDELARRNRNDEINSALERKFLAAFTVKTPRRKYLAELLDDWEKRNSGC